MNHAKQTLCTAYLLDIEEVFTGLSVPRCGRELPQRFVRPPANVSIQRETSQGRLSSSCSRFRGLACPASADMEVVRARWRGGHASGMEQRQGRTAAFPPGDGKRDGHEFGTERRQVEENNLSAVTEWDKTDVAAAERACQGFFRKSCLTSPLLQDPAHSSILLSM